jgi:hypothetical protein
MVVRMVTWFIRLEKQRENLPRRSSWRVARWLTAPQCRSGDLPERNWARVGDDHEQRLEAFRFTIADNLIKVDDVWGDFPTYDPRSAFLEGGKSGAGSFCGSSWPSESEIRCTVRVRPMQNLF